MGGGSASSSSSSGTQSAALCSAHTSRIFLYMARIRTTAHAIPMVVQPPTMGCSVLGHPLRAPQGFCMPHLFALRCSRAVATVRTLQRQSTASKQPASGCLIQMGTTPTKRKIPAVLERTSLVGLMSVTADQGFGRGYPRRAMSLGLDLLQIRHHAQSVDRLGRGKQKRQNILRGRQATKDTTWLLGK